MTRTVPKIYHSTNDVHFNMAIGTFYEWITKHRLQVHLIAVKGHGGDNPIFRIMTTDRVSLFGALEEHYQTDDEKFINDEIEVL